MVTLDPGAFSHRLDLMTPVATPDGQGGASITYSLLAQAWARVEPLSVSSSEEAGGETFRVTHEIWLRARGDLVPGMRLVRGGRIFRLAGFRDPDETGRYTVCRCEEERP
ncbi:phage head closure protein [Martelella sp. AD-3]|uniref:phage head closure protein n=1 Tax=Martelella sp. AD-3 TaxID=686597 RepID=UPI0004B7269B|nr:phage head closure protein [Martelella sp. AD-3]AMM85018.1 head-tail adaptor protein [Martelella sp. AD-3]MAM09037.1 head-tail adaptor protein [Rhizobiaceae bacterium]